MKNIRLSLTLTLLSLLLFSQCRDENDNFVLIPLEQDVNLGRQVSQEIASDPETYPILNETAYPEAYDYLEGIINPILNSGEVTYRDEFAWEFYIIEDDETLNAFATPGGYIYVYTGLIKFLENEDDLAGVIGHEIAHSDLRHSIRNLQRQYGLQILLSVALGEEAGTLAEIAGQITGTLAGLRFSREFEAEADDRSVDYLAQTAYNCAGARTFFEQLIEQGQTAGVPEFLSTHPDPANRVDDISAKAREIGCDTTPFAPDSYEQFKNMLP